MKVCYWCAGTIPGPYQPDTTRQGFPLCGPCFTEYVPLLEVEMNRELAWDLMGAV